MKEKTSSKNRKLLRQIGTLILVLFGVSLIINGIISIYQQVKLSLSYFSEASKSLTDYVEKILTEYKALPWALDYLEENGDGIYEEYDEDSGYIYIEGEDQDTYMRILNDPTNVTSEELESYPESARNSFAEIFLTDMISQCISMERILSGMEISVSRRMPDGNVFVYYQGDRSIDLEKAKSMDQEILMKDALKEIPYEHHDGKYHHPEAHNYWFEGMEGEAPRDCYEWIHDPKGDPANPLKLYVYTPVIVEGKLVAVVSAERVWSRAEIRQMELEMLMDIFNNLLYLVFCAIALLLSIYFLVIKPIAKFQMAVQTYREDKDTDRVVENLAEIRSRNEIGRLTTDVSDMAVSLRRYSEDLVSITAEKERIGAELDVAAQIQSGILPKIYPGIPAFEDQDNFSIYASMRPAKEVGGDLFDFFLIDEDHLALVIGDVSGKGVPAALFMAITTSLIRHELQENTKTITEVLHSVNNCLCEGNDQMMFVTIWAAILELSTGKLTSSNGGHDFPMIRRNGGAFTLAEEKGGIALGVMEDTEYQENTYQLEGGDTVYVYTDGFPEAMNGRNEQFEMNRMIDALNEIPDGSPEELENKMHERVAEFVGEAEQFDDMTMLCVKFLKKR